MDLAKKRADLFFLLVALALIFIIAARTPVDSDMWWHLRAGEATLQQGKPLLSDIFSYTRYGQPWINHSWLAEVIMYLAFQAGSFFALGFGVALLATVSMYVVYLQMEGSSLLKAFVLVLGAIIASLVWSPRPQIFSLVFLALVAYLLYLYKWHKQDRLIWLIPIFILWSNFHGGFPLGLILIGLTIAGEIFNHLLGSQNPEMLDWKKIFRLTIWLLVSAIVILANPNGINTWLIPFQTVNVNALQNLIAEWASPNFHEPVQQLILLLLFGGVASFALSGRHADGTDLLTFIGFAVMALIARRNFGPFAIVTVPVFSRYLHLTLNAWKARFSENQAPGLLRRLQNYNQKRQGKELPISLQRGFNLIFVGLLVFVAAGKLVTVTQPVIVDAAVKTDLPLNAITWIKENHPDGNLFSEYNWGGYFVYTLRDYPDFVDGRTDLFGDEIIGEWIQIVQAEGQYQDLLDKYGVQVVLLNSDRPLINVLRNAGWKEVFNADNATMLTRQ
jgi:hypothetical protein